LIRRQFHQENNPAANEVLYFLEYPCPMPGLVKRIGLTGPALCPGGN
jgi:hypothetical protein